MIPTIQPERILSRSIFELNFGAGEVFSTSVFADVCKEVTRLLPRIISVNLYSMKQQQQSSSTQENLFTVISQTSDTNISLIEIKDSRVASFLCDILEERRVLRLTSGNGKCQLSWFVGGTKDHATYTLAESSERAEEELRMNIDEELWSQAIERRQDVIKWLKLYSSSNTSDHQDDESLLFNLENIESAFIRATTILFSMNSASQKIIDQDPFSKAFFLGAFDKDGRPTVISSFFPILAIDVKPSAKSIATIIARTKNVYFKSLCLLYLRYRCNPENIVSFFANSPPKYSRGIESNELSAPSIFTTLGKVFEDDNSNSPLLDTSLIQTSLDGSSTTTMKEFSRALLLEDELVELWLPTYTIFGVDRLNTFIELVDSHHQEVIDAMRNNKQQQQKNNIHHHHQTHRRGRGDNDNNIDSTNNTNNQDSNKDRTKNSLLLPGGIKSMSQFAALIEEQKRQDQERKELEKQKELEEEDRLRQEYAGTADEQLQRREIFQRQAAALKDRRRRDILERLKSTADAKDRANILMSLQGGSSPSAKGNNNRQHNNLREQQNLELVTALTGTSTSSLFSDDQVVNGSLLNQSVVYFGVNPPVFASLPPFYNQGGVKNTEGSSGNSSSGVSSSPLANLCSTTTVGTEDLYVCF